MKRRLNTLLITALITLCSPVKADFGDADFPVGMFQDGPKSYHDAWCRKLKQECRVRFQGPAMWVEGQGGIDVSQYIRYRYKKEGGDGLYVDEDHYNYISYRAKNGQEREALFLFAHQFAQRDFMRAFMKWKKQEPLPRPNYRLPASQGPQETHGRDKGNNPYDNPPITDWSEKTTKESPSGINCNSPVYKNKPMCN
tara:strand:- start:129 stop:719 length:591 start_codon:yes stop_codon:yes gene_type:complete